jgi:hypothetical protein
VACSGDGDPPPPPAGTTTTTLPTTDSVPDTATDSGTAAYHPDGFEDPAVHGLQAKLQQDDCQACHGTDLHGGDDPAAISCDTCHAEGWRADCTFCHGGVSDQTGAPPEDIDDSSDSASLSFPPHSAHVQDTDLKAALPCSACHATPSDALDDGHFMVGDSTAGTAETDFNSSIAPEAIWDAATLSCSAVWCHGDGQGHNGAAKIGETEACGTCHAGPDSDRDGMKTLSGRHAHHMNLGYTCRNCHESIADDDGRITDIEEHVNGVVTLDIPEAAEMAVDDGGATPHCTGTCHGERHEDRTWDPNAE